MMKSMLILAIVSYIAHSYTIEQNNDAKNYLFTVKDIEASAEVSWRLLRVAKLPGGVKLPDFFNSFIDIIDDIDYCAIQTRRRVLMSEAEMSGLKKLAEPLLSDQSFLLAMTMGQEPKGLSPDKQFIYNQLVTMSKAQGMTVQQVFTQFQSAGQGPSNIPSGLPSIPTSPPSSTTTTQPTISESTKAPVDKAGDESFLQAAQPTSQSQTSALDIKPIEIHDDPIPSVTSNQGVGTTVEDYVTEQKGLKVKVDNVLNNFATDQNISVPSGTSISKIILDDVNNRLNYLQSGSSQEDLAQKFKMVVLNKANKPTMSVEKKQLIPGYAYYFEATVNGQTVQSTLALSKEDTYSKVEELPNLDSYITLTQTCFRHSQTYTMQYDIREVPELQNKSITKITIEIAPFIQFANTDVCVESIGWRVKKEIVSETIKTQVIKFTIPFTPQDTLAAYIQFTVLTDDGYQFIGFKRITVKGMVIQMGKIMKQIESNQDLSQIAQLTGPALATKTGPIPETIDLANMNATQLMGLISLFTQVSQVTSVQNSNVNSYEALAMRVLAQCGDSFSWMVQKLKSQFKNTTVSNQCGTVQCDQGKCNSKTKKCECTLGHAGPACQYQFEEYQALLAAQNKVLHSVIKNNKTNDMGFNDLINQVQMVSTQDVSDLDSVEHLSEMVNISVAKIDNPKQLPQLLEAIRGLKNNYQKVGVNGEEKNIKMRQIGDYATKAIQKCAKKNNTEMYAFTTPDFSGFLRQLFNLGEIQPVLNWTELDEIHLQLTDSVVMNGTSTYYKAPTAQFIGIKDFTKAKSVMFIIQQCAYQGMENCQSPVVVLSLLDDQGEEIPQTAKPGQSFTLQIPVDKSAGTSRISHLIDIDLDCGWLDKNNTIKTEGCESMGVKDDALYCNCTHLTRFIAVSQKGTLQQGGQPVNQTGNSQSLKSNNVNDDEDSHSSTIIGLGIIAILVLA